MAGCRAGGELAWRTACPTIGGHRCPIGEALTDRFEAEVLPAAYVQAGKAAGPRFTAQPAARQSESAGEVGEVDQRVGIAHGKSVPNQQIPV